MSSQWIVEPCTKRSEQANKAIRELTTKPIGKVFCGYKMTRSKQPRRLAVYAKLWAEVVK